MEENKKNALNSTYVWVIIANAIYILVFYFIMKNFS